MKIKAPQQHHLFCIAISMLLAIFTGALWTSVFLTPSTTDKWGSNLFLAIACTLALPIVLRWQLKLHRRHLRKVLLMLDAIENNDSSIHFSETEEHHENQRINHALNRVAQILYNVKKETAQQEKYYELILDCINTGVVVFNDNGAVYQKNSEALRLLGLNVFTHVSQLNRVDPQLARIIGQCRSGDKLQVPFSNERGTVNLSIRVSNITIHQEPLRILALNDINTELDEKEIDSWIRLTRILTHEIMNAITPITSLSDTLLELTVEPQSVHTEAEIRNGLQTISSTSKGLLAFVKSYRKFTRIPTPAASLFYVKSFIERMTELAHHQYPDTRITFCIDVTPDDLILHADEHLISQVVTNLLKNAMQALDASALPAEERRISIRAYCNEVEAVLIEISNNGPAIPSDIAEHIFIPFFTTKESGSGIGLSISRQIMRLSGGSLSLIPGKDTTFALKFN